MAGLLDDLFGFHYDTPAGAVNLGQYPADTNAPSVNPPGPPGTTSPSSTVMASAPPGVGAIPPSPTGGTPLVDPDITIQGDAWKPAHRSILGKIGDILAVAGGGRPVYEPAMQQKDLESAYQGFDQNPIQAIHRLAQIPGQQGKAYQMWQQYTQNQDKQDSRKDRDAAKEMIIGDRLGAMAGAANPQNWSAMRQQMVNMLGVWGKKPEDYDIPENFDQTWADAASRGAISAAKQAQLNQTNQYNLQKESLQTQRLTLQKQEEQDRNNHFDINQDNKASRNAKPFSYADPDFVKQAGGPAIISGDRMHMIVTKPDRTQWGFQNSGDANGRTNWTPLGETAASIKKRQAAATAAQGQ